MHKREKKRALLAIGGCALPCRFIGDPLKGAGSTARPCFIFRAADSKRLLSQVGMVHAGHAVGPWAADRACRG